MPASLGKETLPGQVGAGNLPSVCEEKYADPGADVGLFYCTMGRRSDGASHPAKQVPAPNQSDPHLTRRPLFKDASFAQVRDTFALPAKHELYQKDQMIKVFADPLTDIHKTVLDLLAIAAAVYN